MLRIFAIVAVIGLVGLAIWRPAPRPPVASIATNPAPLPHHGSRRPALAPAGALVLVYVVGAVVRPGLYRLGPDARIADALHAAGGMRAGADTVAVNLAAHLADGEEIEVPLLGQPTQIGAGAKRQRTPRARKSAFIAIVDVNTASASALASVPGIGPTIAARIVEVRERDGPFATFDELLDVAGMSQSRLDRAQPHLRL